MAFPLLPIGWSLNYETIFYYVVAFALMSPPKRRFGRIAGSLIGIMMLGIVVPIAFYLAGDEQHSGPVQSAYFLLANPMMLQFLAGVALAQIRLEGRLPRHGAGWGLLGAGLIMFIVLSFFDLYTSLWRPFLWGFPALLVVAGAVSLEADGRVLASRLSDRLGEASYSIYLWHWPVVVILAKSMGVSRPWLFVPLAFCAATTVGLVGWRLVERPLTRIRLAARVAAPVVAAEAVAEGSS